MNVMRFAKDVYRGVRTAYIRTRPIFKGVYKSFGEINTERGFSDRSWENASKVYNDYVTRNGARAVVNDHALLPFLVSTFDKEPVRVLDFGGSTGFGYLWVKNACYKEVNYVVLELPNICELGRKLLPNNDLEFTSEFPSGKFDIVVFASALQSIESYKDAIADVLSTNPKYILLTKLAVGDAPTYATAAVNVRGWNNPHWVFNLNEIKELMKGYNLVFRGAVEGHINQDNFDEELRIGNMWNLLFQVK